MRCCTMERLETTIQTCIMMATVMGFMTLLTF